MMLRVSSSRSLGSFQQFEADYRAMAFENGAGCWQGPARSIKVIRPASDMRNSERHTICGVAWAALQLLYLGTELLPGNMHQSCHVMAPCESAM